MFLSILFGALVSASFPFSDSGEGGKERLGAGLASTSSRGRTALDADLMAGDRYISVQSSYLNLYGFVVLARYSASPLWSM